MKKNNKSFFGAINFMGKLLLIMSVLLLIPIFFAYFYNESRLNFNSFLFPSIITIVAGIIILFFFKSEELSIGQAFLTCSLSWIVLSFFGALPFIYQLETNFVDAYFETVSGFTTTGITMYTNLGIFSKSLLFWRSLIQWIGGLGILTFFIAVFGKSGAHKIFTAESHKINTKRIVPSLQRTVKILWAIYTGFTLFIFLALVLAGSSVFDSLCHALTTLSTGGFSPYDASIGYYSLINHPNYILIEYIIIFGMFLGGTNFLIHYRLLKGDFKAMWDNIEIRYWLVMLLSYVGMIFLERFLKADLFGQIRENPLNAIFILEENFRTILFQTLSLTTTTGFGTQDINSYFFGPVARQLFLVMMFIGGCVGSTGGGFKVMRIGILFKLIFREIRKLVWPKKSINYVIIDKESLEKDEVFRVTAIFFIWTFLILFGGIITALFSKYDGYTSFSGMFSAVGNIGPSFFSVKEMAELHPLIKIVYTFGMLAGRLEILPILVLFYKNTWKL